MSKPDPLATRQTELPLEAAPQPDAEPARAPHRLEVWFDLLDRLAERRQRHEAKEATRAAQPPTHAQVLLDRTVWNIILFARWLRPRLNRRAAAAQRATSTRLRRSTILMAQQSRLARDHIGGWILWQWRLLRTDPDRRLAAFGLIGGFTVPMVLIITLSHFAPAPIEPLLQPYIDASVPVPSAEFIETEQDTPITIPPIEAAPGEIATVAPAPAMPEPPTAVPEEAIPPAPDVFRFENFAQRDDEGNLRLLSHAAETAILTQFPLGTPAVEVMRFFGTTMINAGSDAGEAALAAKARCMAMPINKLFTVKTVACTYGHAMPLPRPARESPRSRVFWIMALSYDRNSRLIDLKIHARTTLASH